MENALIQITNYLLTQSWQIAALVAVIAAVTLALKNRSAHVRYLLWLIVLAKCLVPPLFTVPLAILPQGKTLGPALISNVEMPITNVEKTDMVTSESIALPSFPVTSPTIMERLARVTARQWLGFGWIVGVAAFLLFALVKALRTNSWIWRQRKTLPAELQTGIEDLFSGLGIKTLPKVWLVEGIGQPFVWGLLRGGIYLPADFVKVNSVEHRRSVLGHELSHILRFDAAVNLLQIIAQAVFWFHPFVWAANKKIRAEREKCCDEMAIAHLGAKAKDYRSAIVNILISEHEQVRPVPSLAVAGPVKNIEERIKTMMRPGKKFYRRPSLTAATIVLVLAMVTVPTALVLTARAQTEAASKPEEKASKLLFQAAKAGDLAEVKRLIAEGADVNATDGADVNATDGADVKANRVWTALHEAADRGHKKVAELLIEKGANVNAEDSAGFTPLYYAIWDTNKDMVSLLVSKGAELHLPPEEEYTPLYYAVWSGNLDIVKLLVDKGTKFDVKTRDYTALRYAALQGSRDMVQFFISKGADASGFHMAAFMGDLSRVKEFVEKGTKVDTKDEAGWTPLFWAVSAGREKVAEFLINNNADISATDASWQSLLYQAAQADAVKLAELLIAKGADVNAKNNSRYGQNAFNSGRTPLHLACRKGNKEMVELLISKGADVNAKNNRRDTLLHLVEVAQTDIVKLLIDKGANVNASGWLGQTPLHRAAKEGEAKIVELLIAKGADVNAINMRGHTPLDMAEQKGHTDIVELFKKHGAKDGSSSLHVAVISRDIEQVKLLISQGADINAKDNSGRTPLRCAAIKGGHDIVELLITKGADVKASESVLPLAARFAHEDVVELLIDSGADVNARERSGGWTPLHYAVAGRRMEMVELLIAKGADLNATDRADDTPLDLAKKIRRNDIVELLKKHGAKE